MAQPPKRRSRRKPTWFESLPPAEQRAFLVQQCIDTNCPCQGDHDHHDAWIAINDVRVLARRYESDARHVDDCMEALALATVGLQRAYARMEQTGDELLAAKAETQRNVRPRLFGDEAAS
ncbi:MAG: hypothetical protein NUW01_04705 [Gemmatimonadaceae bacterium]|nr:hypothetical protein [Gemmatimonadaceae bacterium]